MNHEIVKFRAIQDSDHSCSPKSAAKWVYGYYMHNDAYGDMPHAIFCMNRKIFVPVLPETLGQCTWLIDRNKSVIYSGDILQSKVGESVINIGDVQFSYGTFGVEWVRCKKNKSMVGGWGQLHNLKSLDDGINLTLEIIGNVHENPELIS